MVAGTSPFKRGSLCSWHIHEAVILIEMSGCPCELELKAQHQLLYRGFVRMTQFFADRFWLRDRSTGSERCASFVRISASRFSASVPTVPNDPIIQNWHRAHRVRELL
jgi:hypothetical protein